MLLSDLNKQRQAVGASTVLPQGQTAPPVKQAKPVGVTYDPNTRTISGGNSGALAAADAKNKNVYVAPTNPNAAAVYAQNEQATHQAAVAGAQGANNPGYNPASQPYQTINGVDYTADQAPQIISQRSESLLSQINALQGDDPQTNDVNLSAEAKAKLNAERAAKRAALQQELDGLRSMAKKQTPPAGTYAGNSTSGYRVPMSSDQEAENAYSDTYTKGKAAADAKYQNLVAQGFGDAAGAQYQQDMQKVTQSAQAAKDAIINGRQNALHGDLQAGQNAQTQSPEQGMRTQRKPIDQNAVERMRAAGLSDQEIRTHIANGTMPDLPTNVHAAMTPAEQGMMSPGIPIQGQQGSPTGSPAGGPTSPVGATTPVTPTNGTPTPAGTPTGTAGGQTPPPVDTSMGAFSAALTTALAGNPMGDIYKQAILQDYQAEQQRIANATMSMGSSITQATQDNMDTQAFLQKWADKATSNNGQLLGVLQTINESTNKYLSEQKANDLATLDFNRNVDIQKKEKEKASEMLKSSISMALNGGSYSGAGQQALVESERAWDIAIQNISKEYAFKAADVSTFYTQKYVDAKNQLKMDVFNASNALDAKIEGYAQQGFASIKAEQAAKTKAHEDYRSTIDNIVKDHAKTIEGYVKEIQTDIDKNRDDKRAQEQIGWTRLENAIKSYGSFVPKSLLDSIGKQLPGVDVSGVAQQMTLAEMKQFKMKSLVGSAGDGAVGPISGSTASMFDNAGLTKEGLSEAIKRVARVFGKSQTERVAYQKDMMRRLNSGESLGSVAESLTQDYFVSTDDKNLKNSHDDNNRILSGLDAIQSYADQYSVTTENDGPLGPISSRIEGIKSLVGLSSDAYNNLSSTIGNLRSDLVHARYGSAVSAQELALARSFIPDMHDKGPKFLANVQNLRIYTDYLDKKSAAVNLGLPPPPPPKPITMTGESVVGPGKYSNDDILSSL